jgi:hypothetical protein
LDPIRLKDPKHPKITALSFDRQRSLLACLTENDFVTAWEVPSLQEKHALMTSGHAKALALDPRRGRVAVCGEKGPDFVLHSLADRERLVLAETFNDSKDYIMWAWEGYYLATPEAEKLCDCRLGRNPAGGKLVDHRQMFCRPDLVARKLAGQDVPLPRGVGAP